MPVITDADSGRSSDATTSAPEGSVRSIARSIRYRRGAKSGRLHGNAGLAQPERLLASGCSSGRRRNSASGSSSPSWLASRRGRTARQVVSRRSVRLRRRERSDLGRGKGRNRELDDVGRRDAAPDVRRADAHIGQARRGEFRHRLGRRRLHAVRRRPPRREPVLRGTVRHVPAGDDGVFRRAGAGTRHAGLRGARSRRRRVPPRTSTGGAT